MPVLQALETQREEACGEEAVHSEPASEPASRTLRFKESPPLSPLALASQVRNTRALAYAACSLYDRAHALWTMSIRHGPVACALDWCQALAEHSLNGHPPPVKVLRT